MTKLGDSPSYRGSGKPHFTTANRRVFKLKSGACLKVLLTVSILLVATKTCASGPAPSGDVDWNTMRRSIGDPCRKNEECVASIKGAVYCHFTNIYGHARGYCSCTYGIVGRTPYECLYRFPDIHEQCDTNAQCRGGNLGKYSRCNYKTARCEPHCSESMAYHSILKTCFPRKKINERCKYSKECSASLGPYVMCRNKYDNDTDKHPDNMVCMYDDSSFVQVHLVMAAFAAFVILACCFCVLIMADCDRHVCVNTRKKGRDANVTGRTTDGAGLRRAKFKKSPILKENSEFKGRTIWSCFWSADQTFQNHDMGMETVPKSETSPAAECLLPGIKIIKKYSSEEIISQSMIGKGNFGEVFKGTLNGTTIAVKKIKSELHSDTILEMETVAKFSHPNVLSLVGYATNSAPETIWLLFEFMELGDLLDVLKKYKFKPSSSPSNNYVIIEAAADPSYSQLQLTSDTLLDIASQIAKGMAYLSSRRFVHRDLAARNCLVGTTGVIKIADFGLSRDVHASHYYKGNGGTPLPVRWMAPECITHLRFTVESDVWAYGILLYEMYSWGGLPYFWLTEESLMQQIEDVVLRPPMDCPVDIKALMSGCLEREPKSRLTFQQICDKLVAFRQSLFPGKSVFERPCAEQSITIYSTEDITSMTVVGEGCFGQVFKGTLHGAIIAVKKIKSEHYSDIIREIDTVAKFSHPNILPLLGVTKKSDLESPWLLFEFMEHGDLAGVLRDDKFKPISSTTSNSDIIAASVERPNSLLQLTKETLLSMASQVAEGMKYLSSHRFIHRDLAARNCLVGGTGIIKISDFGLSRDVYSGDYYCSSGNKRLPIRWMAPESIGYGNFTVESDVWSYGILLWEMYSFGKQPYFGLPYDDVMNRITNCVLLRPPENCPTFIQERMFACWKKDPKSRPTFAQICERFEALRQQLDEEKMSPSSDYLVPRLAKRKDVEKEQMNVTYFLVPQPVNLPEFLQVAEN